MQGALSREWFSLPELAEETLPGLPASRSKMAERARREGWDRTELTRKREGRGGGLEYHFSLLPPEAQTMLAAKYGRPAQDNQRVARPRAGSAESWAWYDAQPQNRKDEAKKRASAVARVEALTPEHGAVQAVNFTADEVGVHPSSIRNWIAAVKGVARADRLPALTPLARGGEKELLEIDERAWDFIRADYLRMAEPSYESCYRRLETACVKNGWALPPARTLRRRLEAISAPVQVLARKGKEAAAKMFPAQERDRSMFHAMQAVNADGHKWDVFVLWGYDAKGKPIIGRPMMMAFQDLYSGKFVSWRYAKSENKETVRLAFGDMCYSYGIPDECYFDNGRAFASKWLTGRMANRYRFTIRDEEPAGILIQLGVRVHWTTPYHGQSKPIERGFKDFAQDIARGPWFQGAYTGNTPLAKPEDYGSRAIPIEEFKRIVDHEIMMHNQRPGRRSRVCGGQLSFNQAFDASLALSDIRKPTEEQMRICLLAGEQVSVRGTDGSVHLHHNRYWHEKLLEHRSEKVIIRFDPDNIQQDLPVYRQDGTLICTALLVEAVGFADADAAREHAKAKSQFMRGVRDQRDAERKLGHTQVAALLTGGDMPVPQRTAAKISGNLALKADTEMSPDAVDDFDRRFAASLRKLRAANSDF
jgi:transposase InsO family protein